MHSSRKLEIIKKLRIATVLGIGTLGVLAVSFLVANGLRNATGGNATLSDLAAILFGGVLIGLFVTFLFCLLAFHAFSFFESTTLPQAIRLNEAMRILHAKTHQESRDTLKFYRIAVFKAENALGEGIEENIPCKLISTFLSPWFFRSDQNAAFGSNNHCCDFEQIQSIIESNKAKWGTGEQSGDAAEHSGNESVKIIALERSIADLHEKNKEITSKYTAAAGREGRLKKQQAEVSSHMATLVELANKVTTDFKPPKTITRDAIKTKYLAIGKLYGITEAPGEYVEIFRKAMPKDIINWSGAPSQGSDEEET